MMKISRFYQVLFRKGVKMFLLFVSLVMSLGAVLPYTRGGRFTLGNG